MQTRPKVAAAGTGGAASAMPAEGQTAALQQESRLSSLYKESKVFHQRYRALVDASDVRPTSANVEFSRRELRNTYLKLLFHFTFAGRTREMETYIWMETTHTLVHIYRSQLSVLERKIAKLKDMLSKNGTSKQDEQQQQKSTKKAQLQQSQLAQSYLKLASSFRTFLAAEETFWRDLAGRMARLYDVQEAFQSLQSLGILSEKADADLQSASGNGIDRTIGLEGIPVEAKQQALLPANRLRLIEIIHKTLICCGDLARYSELYREDAPSDASHPHDEDAGKTNSQRGGARGRGRGRGGAGRDTAPSHRHKQHAPRQFTRAADCYEQARHLLPSNGNPWNQLAVLATYREDQFTFVYDCYRALCVSEPFERAKGNMERTLQKAFDKWLEKDNGRKETKEDAAKRKRDLSSSVLLQDLVILHAAFFLRHQEMLFSTFQQKCAHSTSALLRQRALQTDVIVRIAVTTIAALWLRRLWRGSSPTGKDSGIASSIVTEQSILLHLCDLAQIMLEIGSQEMVNEMRNVNHEEAIIDAQEHRRRRNITAVLRRMLPAIRILSKWFKSHLEYVNKARQQQSQHAFSATSTSDEQSAASASSAEAYAKLALGVDRFWHSYAHFINIIRFAFPFDTLPNLGTSVGQSGMSGIDFEEDRDMRGFAPMKKSIVAETAIDPTLMASGQRTPSLHPNEEHLIRIADILIDAKVIAESETSPIVFDDAKNTFYFAFPPDSQLSKDDSPLGVQDAALNGMLQRAPRQPDSVALAAAAVDDDDDDWRNASESSEDAVDLAMRAVDEQRYGLTNDLDESDLHNRGAGEGHPEARDDDDDDDDEIILIPHAQSSSHSAAANTGLSAREAESVVNAPKPESLTAQHLLLQVLNGSPRSLAPSAAVSLNDAVEHGSIVGHGRPGSASGSALTYAAPASFGPIGSPLSRGTASPVSSGHAHQPVPSTVPVAPSSASHANASFALGPGTGAAALWDNTDSAVAPSSQRRSTDIWGSGLPLPALSKGATTAGTMPILPTQSSHRPPIAVNAPPGHGWVAAPTAPSALRDDWTAIPRSDSQSPRGQGRSGAPDGTKW